MREIFEQSERLQVILINHATGRPSEDDEYVSLRRELIAHPVAKNLVPTCVLESRSLDQFWQWIKSQYGTYAERRQFIWRTFSPLITFCEEQILNQNTVPVSRQIAAFGANYVSQEWQKATSRSHTDPAGAITIARTLLESVCKHILEEHEISCEHAFDIQSLYKQTARCLTLSPGQHSEEIFKQVLGGCASVVNGLGAIRNQLGDSHGKNSTHFKPSPRHAELAVNLAGSMASFLIQTHQARQQSKYP